MPDVQPIDDRPDEARHGAGEPFDHFEGDVAHEPEPAAEYVSEDAVAGFLDNIGGILNWIAPTPEHYPEAWYFTDAELAAIAPPLTRIANDRAPALAATVTERSDEVAVAVQLSRYVGRNFRAIRVADEDLETPDDLERAAREAYSEPAEAPDDGADFEPDEHQRPYFEQ